MTSHTATGEWKSFEIRMQRRRAERLLLRASTAADARSFDEARIAIDEVRALWPGAPGLDEIEQRLAERPIQLQKRSSGWKEFALGAAVVLFAASAAFAAAFLITNHPADVAPSGEHTHVDASDVVLPTPSHIEPPQQSTDAVETRPQESQPQTIPTTETARASNTPRPTDAPRPMDTARPTDTSQPTDTPRPKDTPQRMDTPRPTDTPRPMDAPQPMEPPRPDERAAASPAPLIRIPSVPTDPTTLRTGPTPVQPLEIPSAPASAAAATAPAAAAKDSAAAGKVPAAAGKVSANLPPPQQDALVSAVLTRFADAYSNLDVDAAVRVWPGVNRSALARAFESLASQHISLSDCQIRVDGGAAQARCVGAATWRPKVGGGERTDSRTWNFELEKAGAAWQIVSARVQNK